MILLSKMTTVENRRKIHGLLTRFEREGVNMEDKDRLMALDIIVKSTMPDAPIEAHPDVIY